MDMKKFKDDFFIYSINNDFDNNILCDYKINDNNDMIDHQESINESNYNLLLIC